MSKEKVPYEDIVVSNLIDPSIDTLSRSMAQYLIEKVYEGKNIIITGVQHTGRTLLLNILAKNIHLKKKVLGFEILPELVLLEHDVYFLDIENISKDQRAKEYYLISKGFPHYEQDCFIMDDLPVSSYINYYKILMSNKQVLTVVNNQSNYQMINQMLQSVSQNIEQSLQNISKGLPNIIDQIGVNLVEKVDILVHIRKYEDGFIRIGEISETKGYVPNSKEIVLETIFEYKSQGRFDSTGKLVGDFIKC